MAATLVPRYVTPLWARISWNVGVAVYTAAVGLLLVLDQRVPDNRAKWLHNPKLLVGAVAVLLVVTLVDAVRRAILRVMVAGRERARVEVRNHLASALVSVAESEGLNVSDLGCGLFLRKPAGLRRPEQLIRPERVRIPDDLHETPVQFLLGKGAVGAAWQHKTPMHSDWIAINKRYANRPEYVASRWEKIPEKTRRGFTLTEFTGMVGKYAEVLAVPIIIEGEFVGCIALDRRWNEGDTSDRCVLNTDPTKKVLGAAAKTLVAAIKK